MKKKFSEEQVGRTNDDNWGRSRNDTIVNYHDYEGLNIDWSKEEKDIETGA